MTRCATARSELNHFDRSNQACARLAPAREAATRAHAIATLSGLFLGLAARAFYHFSSEVLDALCGIDRADATFGGLADELALMLPPPAAAAAGGGKGGRVLQHCAVRLLLAVAAAADNLSANIALEFLLLRQGTGKNAGASTLDTSSTLP